MALSVRNIAIQIDEVRCNSRSYGRRGENQGSNLTFGWRINHYTIFRHMRETDILEEYSFTNDKIKRCNYTKAGFDALFFELSAELCEEPEWKYLTGNDEGSAISLAIVARLPVVSDGDSEVEDREDLHAWKQLTEQLSKLPSCTHVAPSAMRLLVYPSNQKVYIDSFANVERNSMKRMERPASWLNDELINAGLRFVEQDLIAGDYALSQRTLFLGSGWWPQLDKGRGKSVLLQRFAKLHKKDIFGLDYIIAPINIRASHWVLCVICYPGNVVRMAHMDHVANPDTDVQDKCTILLLDPLEGDADDYLRYFRIIREYLQAMASVRVNKPVRVLEREIPPGWIVDRMVKVPQQQNTWDCGLYVLHFARRFVALNNEVLRTQVTDDDAGKFWGERLGTDMRSELRERLKKAAEAWIENQRL
ncbi:hypothetical protein FRC06_005625 [Ceratobasidium sp. 370]|nr:hypothetical protein FRC06_005625 [Ceratobasidium sp. 370]